MVAGEGGETNTSTSGPGAVGVLARALVAALAVVLGLIWIVRLAVVGSTLTGGLLFEVLPPLVLLYFGTVYLRTQRRALRDDS